MKMSKYIRLEIKQALPLFIIYTIFMALVSILGASNSTLYTGGVISTSTNVPSFTIMAFIFALVYPLNLYLYRYKKSSVDFYYQLPIDKRKIRRCKFLVGLSGLLISFIVFYLFSIIILMIRVSNATPPASDYYHLIDYNFGAYFIALPIYILVFALTYSLSAFLSSIGNNAKDTILIWIFGFCILTFCFSSFSTYVYMLIRASKGNASNLFSNPLASSFSPLFLYIDTNLMLSKFIYYVNPFANVTGKDLTVMIITIIFYVINVIFGILAFLYVWFKKEISGEYCVINGGYNTFTKLLPHICAFIISLYVSSLWYIFGYGTAYIVPILLFFVYVTAYYLSIALYYKRWKISKIDLFIFIGVVGFAFLTSFAMLLVDVINHNSGSGTIYY